MSGSADTLAEKAAVRALVRARIDAMGAAERAAASVRIVEAIVASRAWRSARRVLAYLAMPGEADVDGLWAQIGDGGRGGDRVLAAPRTVWAERSMVAAVLGEVGGAVEVRAGLREPGVEAAVIGVEHLDLVLVPGLAFDAGGGRLGRGGGFYDRFLSGLPGSATVIGVGFGCQVVEAVPVEAHDVRVGGVVTEAGWVGPGGG